MTMLFKGGKGKKLDDDSEKSEATKIAYILSLSEEEAVLALHNYVERGESGEMNFLIKTRRHFGIVADCVNEHNSLMVAARDGMEDAIVVLSCYVRTLGDYNVKNKYGWTALHFAALMGHDRIVDHLVKKGADPNICNNDGQTPLHVAAREGHTNVIETLAFGKKWISVDDQDRNLCTALHLCVCWAPLGCLKAMLNFVKIDVDRKTKSGCTPLYCASYLGREEMVEVLLLYTKANVNAQNKTGDTPLHAAVRSGHVAVVEILLGNKADISIKNNDKMVAEDYATSSEMKILFTKYREKISSLPKSSGGGDEGGGKGKEEEKYILEEKKTTCRALYDFVAQSASEMSFQSGDFITNVTKLNGDWWLGTCNGLKGCFPANYVEEVTPSQVLGALLEKKKKKKKKGLVIEQVGGISGTEAVALYDYEGSEGDLSFKVGDVLTILQKHTSGWWLAQLNGKTGAVPSNYLEIS